MTENSPRAPLPFGGAAQGPVHSLPVRIYYADTDFSGFVYHGRYVEFMERGRTEALRACGLIDQMARAQAGGGPALFFAVSKLSIAYKAPAHIDDLLTVKTRAEKLTGARIFLRQQIWRGETLLTDGECCLVMLDAAGRPQRIPDSLRETFCLPNQG